MAISVDAKAFYRRIIQHAVDDGFIEAREGNRSGSWEPVGGGGSPCICCCPGGDRNGDAAIVLAIALFALSFFVAFFFTAQSAHSAHQAHRDMQKAPQLVTPQMPVWDGQVFVPALGVAASRSIVGGSLELDPELAVPPPTFALPMYYQAVPANVPMYYQAPPPSASQNAHQYAMILLEGHRNERIMAACSQGLMTIGAGLLTVAFLIHFIARPEITTLCLGLAGAGVGVAGLTTWLAKKACILNDQEQEAAHSLLGMIRV